MHSDTPSTSCALGTSLGGTGGISQQPGNPRGEGKPGRHLPLPGPQERGLPLDGLAEIFDTFALSRKSVFKSHCLGNRTVAGLASQAPSPQERGWQRAESRTDPNPQAGPGRNMRLQPPPWRPPGPLWSVPLLSLPHVCPGTEGRAGLPLRQHHSWSTAQPVLQEVPTEAGSSLQL